jgi:hypothetical protein
MITTFDTVRSWPVLAPYEPYTFVGQPYATVGNNIKHLAPYSTAYLRLTKLSACLCTCGKRSRAVRVNVWGRIKRKDAP